MKAGEFTVEDCLIDIIMHGMDRAAVSRGSGGKDDPALANGVIVFMLSKIAVQRLATPLLALSTQLGSSNRLEDFPDGVTTPMVKIFEAVEKLGTGWGWFFTEFGKLLVTAAVFVGPVCEEVAAVCRANGAPCSLDRRKVSGSHKIWETEEDR